jgi:hypothetical protein
MISGRELKGHSSIKKPSLKVYSGLVVNRLLL